MVLFSTPERPLLFTGSFCNRLKRLYEPNIMAQFVCSMLIICLTAFELMFAKGDPMQMVRFGAYMLAGFYQVFVWSFFGNRVTNMVSSGWQTNEERIHSKKYILPRI